MLLDYGFRDNRYGWYRLHVHLGGSTRDLAVGVQNTSGSYEIFVNGVRIGANGPFPPLFRFNQQGFYGYPIPGDELGRRQDLVLAIRFALNATGSRGRGTSTPIAGDSNISLLNSESLVEQSSYAAGKRVVPILTLAALAMLTGLVALALYLAMPSRREYLAAAAYMIAFSVYDALSAYWAATFITFERGLMTGIFFGAIGVALIEFMCRVIGVKRTRWITSIQIVTFLVAFAAALSALPFFPFYFGFVAYFMPMMLVDVWLAILLLRAWVHGNREARVLLPALLLITFADYWTFFNYLAFYVHLTPAYHPLPRVHIAGYEMSLLEIGDFFSFITVLLFLVLRTVGIARHSAQAKAELEAARTMQQLLLARAEQATSGFQVETVYHPASEVGGDFFFVSPVANNALLAVVGDVSGKGLIAAMRVSMILGALRREDSSDPATVLRNLNAALSNDGHGGFTTACCIRLERDGHYTLANAGHIAPYIGGEEIATSPALPLGLAPDQEYTVASGKLSSGQRIVLLSDGVVEARSTTGELFGFDRVQALTLEPARQIADAAHRFGQEDDITVVTLACMA